MTLDWLDLVPLSIAGLAVSGWLSARKTRRQIDESRRQWIRTATKALVRASVAESKLKECETALSRPTTDPTLN